jgi:hypothetical protein
MYMARDPCCDSEETVSPNRPRLLHLARKYVNTSRGSWKTVSVTVVVNCRPPFVLVFMPLIRLVPNCVTSGRFWPRPAPNGLEDTSP